MWSRCLFEVRRAKRSHLNAFRLASDGILSKEMPKHPAEEDSEPEEIP